MTDVLTKKKLTVSAQRGAWPYIMVPADQLDAVAAILKANQIPFWMDEEVLSLDGGPETGLIQFPRDCDPAVVQGVLDQQP